MSVSHDHDAPMYELGAVGDSSMDMKDVKGFSQDYAEADERVSEEVGEVTTVQATDQASLRSFSTYQRQQD